MTLVRRRVIVAAAALAVLVVGYFGAAEVVLSVALISSVMAAEVAPELLLTGYTKLDAQGVPTDVRVAVTRGKFTALWRLAHPEEKIAQPVVEVATGAPHWQLQARAEGATSLSAELRLPLAVLVDAWRTIRLPVPAGAVTWLRHLVFVASALSCCAARRAL